MEVEAPEFPRYATQIINLASQNAQATRPKVVGQMSELIKEFTGKTIEEWEAWYMERYPEAIPTATQKIMEMIENFRDAMDQIDEDMIRRWVKDMVIVKTFVGLKFQHAVLKRIAEQFNADYRWATPEDESKGIDGYIGGIPVSLKPVTYQAKQMLPEDLAAGVIYYEKQKDGIKVIVPPALAAQLGRMGSA